MLDGLSIVTLFVDTFLTGEYDEHVADNFLEYAQTVSPLIEQSLLGDSADGNEQQVLPQWTQIISDQGGILSWLIIQTLIESMWLKM